jgi:ADP-L-glycero-D-manno-heptose 6-epimerase
MIVVTGGTGFIGSNLVRALNGRGQRDIVIVEDLDRQADPRIVEALAFEELVDYRDFIADFDAWGRRGIEAVFHQGACSDTMVHDGGFMLERNYTCSRRLLEFSLGRCPFIYASSAAVYGRGERGFREESACEWPLNAYAFSKFLFDRHVRARLDTFPTQVVGLRYFNVYGPQENAKGRMASLLYQFHGQASESGTLRIFEGSDGFLRDFVFVDDVVNVNLDFLDHSERSGIFNCGSGAARSFQELAELAASHYAGPGGEGACRVETIPFPESLTGRYQAHTLADLTQLREVGCEVKFTSLEDGVAHYGEVLKASGGYYAPVESPLSPPADASGPTRTPTP